MTEVTDLRMGKKLPPGLLFVLVTLFLDVMGLGLSYPILPKLIEQFVGNISTAAYYYGTVTTLFALMLFVFSPIQGALSDQFGRKPVLLLSLFGTGLSYLAMAVAPNLTWLFAAQILNGITGASVPVASAYIADVSPPETRAKNFGLLGATLAAGWVIGPALGGLLSFRGLQFPFLVAAITTFVNLGYGFLMVSESYPQEHRRSFSWQRANPIASLRLLGRSAKVLGLSAVMLCTSLALQCYLSTWVLFTTYKFHWTSFKAGLSLALLALVTATVQGGAIRPMIRRLGEQRTILVGLGCGLTGFLLYAVAPLGWMMYPVIVLNGFDFAVQPISQGLLSSLIPPQEQGSIQGALASQTAFASIIAPLVATNLFGYFTSKNAFLQLPEVPFLLGSLLFGVALYWAIATFAQFNAQPVVPE
ncbi:MAG: TCR/Tet family MFS transporter [Cyanobacteria bacterium CRU_2_1]|nr:TCR/Tet family MFS transporter [Cyanobacteria bacterium CRU_2_1]